MGHTKKKNLKNNNNSFMTDSQKEEKEALTRKIYDYIISYSAYKRFRLDPCKK